MKLNQQPNKFCYSLLLKGLGCVANADRLYTCSLFTSFCSTMQITYWIVFTCCSFVSLKIIINLENVCI